MGIIYSLLPLKKINKKVVRIFLSPGDRGLISHRHQATVSEQGKVAEVRARVVTEEELDSPPATASKTGFVINGRDIRSSVSH